MIRLIFETCSYYIMAFMVICWIVLLVRFLRDTAFSSATFVAKYRWLLLVTMVMTVFTFVSVPKGMKILDDEAILLSVSRTMLNEREPYAADMALQHKGYFEVVHKTIPKRPLLFPFMLSCFHTVLGFHSWNSLLFNFMLLFFLLAGSAIFFQQHFETPAGIAVIFFLLAQPVLTITATSGGYDLFASVFLLLGLLMLRWYLRNPGPAVFGLLWITLVILANIRYEAIIFMFILLGCCWGRVRWSDLKYNWAVLVLTPLFMLPYLCQRVLAAGTYENPPGVPVFSVTSLIKHLQIFVENFLNLDMYLPYAGWINFFGLFLVLILGQRLWARHVRISDESRRVLLAFFLAVVIHLVIVLSHHFGRYDRPTQARLFLNVALLFSFAPFLLLYLKPQWVRGKKLLMVSVILFFFYHPIAIEHKFMNSLVFYRYYRNSLEILEQFTSKDILIISESPVIYSALGYGSVDFKYANENEKLIHQEYDERNIREIIAIQREKITENGNIDLNRLNPSYQLKERLIIPYYNDEVMRFSSTMQLVNTSPDINELN